MDSHFEMSDPLYPAQADAVQPTDTLLAETYYNDTKPVALADLRQRVSAYAIIIQDEKILMIKTHNHCYYFPGGGVDMGESLTDAVRREAREELNAAVDVGALLYADDMIYYHDPVGRAVHLIRLYYECTVLTHEFSQHNAEERDEILSIEWVPLNALNESDFLPSTWRALSRLRAHRIQPAPLEKE